MLRGVLAAVCFAAFCFPAFAANDVVGTWQGKAANQHILKVTRNHGMLAAVYFNPNTGDPSEHPVSSVSFNGGHLHFTIDLGCVTDRPDSECTYDGDMAAGWEVDSWHLADNRQTGSHDVGSCNRGNEMGDRPFAAQNPVRHG